jgi:hypothetical protein
LVVKFDPEAASSVITVAKGLSGGPQDMSGILQRISKELANAAKFFGGQ